MSDLKYKIASYLEGVDYKNLSASDIVLEVLSALEQEGYQIIKANKDNKEG